MAVRCSRWLPLVVTVGTLLAAPPVHAQKGPPLPDLLKLASDYLVQYSQKLGAVGAEEQYTQYDTSTGRMSVPKRLNDEFVLIGLGNGSTVGFRDVFAIDQSPVRPHDDRLLNLFKNSPESARDQARQLTEDSTRYYISQNLRALDQPTIALEFLRKENQERSTFKIDSVKTMNGAQVAIVKFSEQGTPRLIPSGDNAQALGRFWIDIATGAVRQTELGLNSKVISVTTTVKYVNEPTIGLWLPSELYQQIASSGPGSGGVSDMGGGGGYEAHQGLEGRATFSKYHQVPLDLTKLK